MARKKAEDALTKLVRNSTLGYITRQELIETRVGEGFAPATAADGSRRLQNDDGVFLTERDITATGMNYAQYLANQQPPRPVAAPLEPKRFGATPKPKKKEEELMSSAEVKTSADQVRFAKQQRAAAYRAGDKKGEKAWEELQRDVQRRRLAAAMEAKQQTQVGLFGVTEFDETMPLFGRRDAADPVANLLSATFGESLPGAAVLNWDRHPRGVIAGRLAAEGLVYRFSCDSSSIAYRPAWDGLDESGWEARSEGFLMARSPGRRLDFRFEQKKSKKQCSKGYGCGSSCITLAKECRITPTSAISKQRLRQLQVLAKEGDARAEGLAKKVAEGRSQKAGELVEGRQIGKLKKMLEDPRVAEMIRTGKVPTAEAEEGGSLAGKVKVVAPGEILVDPERFQYKINSNASGEVGSLKGVKKWDDNLAGVISVWQDPADGKTYVVNGHNRLGLANRMGVEGVTVRYLKAGSAKEARAIGAMQNIAEGQGTEIDAAKFFRDTGIKDQAGVEEKGLPLSSGKAEKGLGLARLPEEMFREVVNGTLSPSRGAIIGNSGLDEAKQREIGKMLRSRKSVSDGTLQEYVEAMAVSQRQTQTELDILGTREVSVDDGLARAELVNSIARKIAKEKRLFGMVSQSKAAATLAEKAGNVINKEESAGVASEADQLGRMFKDLKNKSGPMSDAINAAAARVTAGERREAVQRELYEGIVEGMQQELERFGLAPKKPSNEAPTSSLFDSIEARLDAAKKCIKGMACGNSCVPKGRQCRSKAAPAAAGRLQELQAAAGSDAPAAAPAKGKSKRKRKSKAATKPPAEKAAAGAKPAFEATVAAAGKALAQAVMEGPGGGKPAAAPAKELGQWDWKPDHDWTSADGWFSKQFTAQLAKPVKINGEDAEAVTFQIQGSPATYGESQRRRLKAAGFDPPEGKKAIEFIFGTGYDGYIEEAGVDRMEISDPKVARRLALAISKQMKEVVAGLPDGTIVAAGYHKTDGAGEARRKLYEQAGFAFYEQDADSYDPNGFAVVQGGKLQRFPGGRKDSGLEEAEIDLDALVAQLLGAGGGDRADRFDSIFERIARLDAKAKAKASDPGQLDLFGGGSGGSGKGKAPAAAGGGGGKGQPCGESFISGSFTCRKGGGGAKPAPPAQPGNVVPGINPGAGSLGAIAIPRKKASTPSSSESRVAAQEAAIKQVTAERQRQITKGADPTEIPITEKDLEGMEQAKEIMAGRLSPKEQLEKWKAEGLLTNPPAPTALRPISELRTEAAGLKEEWLTASKAHDETVSRYRSYSSEVWDRTSQQEESRAAMKAAASVAQTASDAYWRVQNQLNDREQAIAPVTRTRAHKGLFKLKGELMTNDGAETMLSGFRPTAGELGGLQRSAKLHPIGTEYDDAGAREKSHIPDMPFWSAYDHQRRFETVGQKLSAAGAKQLRDQLLDEDFRETAPGRFERSTAIGERKQLPYGGFNRDYVKRAHLEGFEAVDEIVNLSGGAATYRRTEHFTNNERFLPDHHGPAMGTLKYRGEEYSYHRFSDGSFGRRSWSKGNGSDWTLYDNEEKLRSNFESLQESGQTERDYGIGELAARGGRTVKIKPAVVIKPWGEGEKRDSISAIEARLDAFSDMPAIEAGARNLEGLRGSGGRMPTRAGLIKQERTQERYKINAHAKPKAPAGKGKPCGQSFIPALAECHASRGPNQLGARLRAHFPGLEIKMEQKGGELRIHQLKARGPAPGLMDAIKRYAAGKGLKLAIRTTAEAA